MRSAVIALAFARVVFAQNADLGPVKEQADFLRQFRPEGDTFFPQMKSIRNHSGLLHTALRDWIESRLPRTKAALDAGFPVLAARLASELKDAGLSKPGEIYENFDAGFVPPLQLTRPVEDPDKLLVVSGAGVPCGVDDVLYVYDYSGGERQRILESAGTRDHDESVLGVYVSNRSNDGVQQILTLRYAVQCGSAWNQLSYDLFRSTRTKASPDRVYSGEHEFWDYDANVRLTHDDLLIEFEGSDMGPGFRRTHVRHYSSAGGGVTRVDPVALLPKDFVDEWLKGDWQEMESRSAGDEKLKKWHELLGGRTEVQIVQKCDQRPGHWLIALEQQSIQGKELPESLSVYFIVQDLGDHRYKMVDISFNRQQGCPGDGQPNLFEMPTLFPKKK